MCDLEAARVVPSCELEGIKLAAKLGCQAEEECLCLDIIVFCWSLPALPCLSVSNVMAMFIVNVDSIKFLAIDNSNKACGESFLLAKEVVPAVILIACVITIMILFWLTVMWMLSRLSRWRALMPAPQKLRMTFFPAAIHKSTRGCLFALVQMGTSKAMICPKQFVKIN